MSGDYSLKDVLKTIEKEIQKLPVKINGANNGSFASGMYGIMMPKSMNGPIGNINYPLPYKLELPALLNGPQYNSMKMNAPAYNEQSFKEVSGYTYDNFSSNFSPID